MQTGDGHKSTNLNQSDSVTSCRRVGLDFTGLELEDEMLTFSNPGRGVQIMLVYESEIPRVDDQICHELLPLRVGPLDTRDGMELSPSLKLRRTPPSSSRPVFWLPAPSLVE